MTRVPETFNFGREINDFDDLIRQLDTMYGTLARAINGVKQLDTSGTNKPKTNKLISAYVTDGAPTATAEINRLFEEGQVWIDRSTSPKKVYFLTNRTDADTVQWTAVN